MSTAPRIDVEPPVRREIASLAAEARALDQRAAPAEEALAWVEARFGSRAVLASSFGAEDVVLVDLARRHAPSLRVVTLDTGRLPPETHEVMEATARFHGIDIETFRPDPAAVTRLESTRGFYSFRESVEARRECCALRKLEPLARALAGAGAWVTGLRREQSVTRTGAPVAGIDAEHGGIVKVNPLAGWTTEQVWAHVRARGLPYNALHDRGYPSIGCAPCTRAVLPGEDLRAGRWWWERAEHRECGLHARPADAAAGRTP